MLNLQHPDTDLHIAEVKKITRGGRQAADDQAMEAMFNALDAGVSKEEAEKIFNYTYKKVLYGKNLCVRI